MQVRSHTYIRRIPLVEHPQPSEGIEPDEVDPPCSNWRSEKAEANHSCQVTYWRAERDVYADTALSNQSGAWERYTWLVFLDRNRYVRGLRTEVMTS